MSFCSCCRPSIQKLLAYLAGNAVSSTSASTAGCTSMLTNYKEKRKDSKHVYFNVDKLHLMGHFSSISQICNYFIRIDFLSIKFVKLFY